MDSVKDYLMTSGISSNAYCVLIFAVIFFLTYGVIQSRQPRRRYPPALRSLPIVGSIPFLPKLTDFPEYFRRTAVRLGSGVFSVYLGTEYTIILNGREAINEALVKRSTDYANRNASFTLRQNFNPQLRGIIMKQYDSTFKRYHQTTLSILREFGFGQKIMEQRILIEAEDLVNRITDLKGEPFDPADYLNICTINVINSIAFGQRLPQSHPTIKKMADYYQFFINCGKLFIDYCPPLRFLPKYKALMNEVIERYNDQHDHLYESVKEAVQGDLDGFVKRFAEREGEKYDELDLKYIVNDLLIAGSETTATSLHWSLYYMANNQHIQKRLREEIDSVVSRDRFPSLDDMSSLPQVEAAILECTRIRTVLPLSVMRCTLCDTQVAGYFVPAKTRVLVNLHSVHMDPVEFPEPDTYRPERFLSLDGKVVGREKVIPFSLGKRSCLGELLARQELFLLFATLLQRFQIVPPEGQERVECSSRIVVSQCPTTFPVRLIPI